MQEMTISETQGEDMPAATTNGADAVDGDGVPLSKVSGYTAVHAVCIYVLIAYCPSFHRMR